MLDPRVHPYREDIAADFLEGKVGAARFVAGVPMTVTAGCARLRGEPDHDAPMGRQESQLLFGETFIVYDRADGWCWGMNAADSYVGYAPADALSDPVAEPAHMVATLSTHIYPGPGIKTETLAALSLGSRLALTGKEENGFSELATGGWVYTRHIAASAETEPDFTATAEQFTGAPYLWGGRGSGGIDCSGLVQVALLRSGIDAPRDTDMQEAALGSAVKATDAVAPAGLRRGDIVFFKGHVGIMTDADTLLHANAHHMKTVAEPLRDVAQRNIDAQGAGITSIKRI